MKLFPPLRTVGPPNRRSPDHSDSSTTIDGRRATPGYRVERSCWVVFGGESAGCSRRKSRRSSARPRNGAFWRRRGIADELGGGVGGQTVIASRTAATKTPPAPRPSAAVPMEKNPSWCCHGLHGVLRRRHSTHEVLQRIGGADGEYADGGQACFTPVQSSSTQRCRPPPPAGLCDIGSGSPRYWSLSPALRRARGAAAHRRRCESIAA